MNLKTYSKIPTPVSIFMHNTEKLSYPEDYIFISTCFQSMYFTCRICQKISGFTEWQLYSLVLVGTEIKMPACILIKSCACSEYLRVLETVISLRFFVAFIIIFGIFALYFSAFNMLLTLNHLYPCLFWGHYISDTAAEISYLIAYT